MDQFGDRMKLYEHQEAGRRVLPLLPVCARIDGKGFSKFTKGLQRPYDTRLVELMCQTTAYLVQETQACIGYTQSDEISLVWYSDEYKSQIFFDRRVQKMVSVIASITTAFFNAHLAEHLPEKAGELALFDCRVWQVPTLEEAANTVLWREFDATKNSISMAVHGIITRMRHCIRKRGMRCRICCGGKVSIGTSIRISLNAGHLFKSAPSRGHLLSRKSSIYRQSMRLERIQH